MKICQSLVRENNIKNHSVTLLHIYESGQNLKRHVSKNVEQTELSYTGGRNEKWYNQSGK